VGYGHFLNDTSFNANLCRRHILGHPGRAVLEGAVHHVLDVMQHFAESHMAFTGVSVQDNPGEFADMTSASERPFWDGRKMVMIIQGLNIKLELQGEQQQRQAETCVSKSEEHVDCSFESAAGIEGIEKASRAAARSSNTMLSISEEAASAAAKRPRRQ